MMTKEKRLFGIAIATLMTLPTVTTPTFAHGEKLPLGDGQVSSFPKYDHVYSCKQRFNPNAPGARASGDWIVGDYWYPDRKPTVDGNVMWSGNGAKVTVAGGTRTIVSNLLPSHGTGEFPVKRSDDAYRYDRNPNKIRAQGLVLQLDATPEIAHRASCVPMGMIGVALSGAAIFNALDARGEDAPAHEIQDECGGHPERSGMYHYHNGSDCMVELEKTKSGHSGLVGYALDGFGIYGKFGDDGVEMHNDDLDECHGHIGKVMWDGKEVEMYHYHLTDEYPYTIGCFVGTPVSNR